MDGLMLIAAQFIHFGIWRRGGPCFEGAPTQVVLEYLVPTWGIKEKATGAPLELKPKAFTDLQALPHA